MLLGSEDDFKDAFAVKHASGRQDQKPKAKKVDLIKDLLEMSRKFVLKDLEHDYTNSDQIFYIREATIQRHQIANCISCSHLFESTKQMCFCQFCGYANCKECLKKTRFFFDET